MSLSPSVAIIVLNWNGGDDTIGCLVSLAEVEYSNYVVVVVDNGSTDESIETISSMFKGVKILRNSNNLGFSEGNNVAIAWALKKNFDYVLLLNQDTTVDPLFLYRLVTTAESDNQIAIVGPHIVYYDQSTLSWSTGGYVDSRTGRPIQSTSLSDEGKAASREVDWVSGCALLIKTRVIREIGMLDPMFFMSVEDVDWCIRARKAGYNVFYQHIALVKHKKKTKQVTRKYSHIQQYYTLRNLLIFIEKHGKFNLPFLLSFTNILAKRLLWSLLTLDAKCLKSLWLAVYDFRAKKYGYRCFSAGHRK